MYMSVSLCIDCNTYIWTGGTKCMQQSIEPDPINNHLVTSTHSIVN